MKTRNVDANRWYLPPVIWMLLVPVAVAVIGRVLLPTVASVRRGEWLVPVLGIALSFMGTVLLFAAKLPLYRRRKILTFGSHGLDALHRVLYRWAYTALAVGVGLLLMILLVLQ